MGVKKFLAMAGTVLMFVLGVVVGYLKGFEEGYNLSAGTPYPAETEGHEE
jgi:hypothetical protein